MFYNFFYIRPVSQYLVINIQPVDQKEIRFQPQKTVAQSLIWHKPNLNYLKYFFKEYDGRVFSNRSRSNL